MLLALRVFMKKFREGGKELHFVSELERLCDGARRVNVVLHEDVRRREVCEDGAGHPRG